MLSYIARRILYMVILLAALSFFSFVLIELPPGSFVDNLIQQLRNMGVQIDLEEIRSLEERFGLNLPFMSRYRLWMSNLLRGDLGYSLAYNQPVTKLIGQRLLLTVTITMLTLVITYLIAIPIGIYSATHQYSLTDYAVTVFGFIGLATPNFLLALILMFVFYRYFGWSVGGLFSPEFEFQPWSLAKFLDFLKHLPIPLVVIGTAGTAGLIRVMRAALLDELRKQYVLTGRAKGLEEGRLLFKYPLRIAINPMVSTIGGVLPALVSGEALTAIVVGLPTVGPLLLDALRSQDMYLAGSLVMVLSALAVIGILISDLLLVVVDPRIRFERESVA
jgi:peptide/nickel transport system permease protein